MSAIGDNSQDCYHCGLPVPAGSSFRAVIGGESRAMCCAGCQAVAQTIAGENLDGYYRSRTAFAPASGDGAEELERLRLYDLDSVQADFVRREGDMREVQLLLEGITCSACVWLNEQHLSRMPGVLLAEVNYTTHRALVRWNATRVRLSEILEAVRAIGYRAFPATAAGAEQARRRENRSALWRVFVAGFGMMQVMMYAVPEYLAGDGTMTPDIERLMRIASFVLTVPVVFYSAGLFFRGALRDLRAHRLGMDVPVALGIAVSFVASVIATFGEGGAVYYDSITMFVFFLLGGRYLEMRARQKAVASLEYLDRALPLGAHRLSAYPASHETEEIPAVALRAGDLVLIKPGEVIPADGVLVSGETETDEALLTGESLPVLKRAGAALVAGAVNRLSPVVMRVERVGEGTRASHIRRLTERAAGQRPPIVEITDRIAGWFIAAVLLIAAGATLYWLQADPGRALWIGVAVLVVTCPCALSLATPTALAVSVGTLARRGVVVTRVHAIEALERVTHVVLDKTGTLTQGRLSLAASALAPGVPAEHALSIAAALERGSEHPIAQAILQAAEHLGVSIRAAAQLRAIPGAGMEGVVDGIRYRLGSRRYVAQIAGVLPATDDAGDGTSAVWLGSEGCWLARFNLRDALRPEAREVVQALRARGKRVLVLSGDEPTAVGALARSLGIDEFEGAMTPEGKQARVRALQEAGAVVAMVGDGVNDAPVLAQAQLSVAMGSGAVVSQAQSDLVLLSGRLGGLLDALAISRRTLRVVRENLWWATLYNVIALPLAVAGYVTPWMAGIGMAGSSLLVVLNALRLIETRERREEGPAGTQRGRTVAAAHPAGAGPAPGPGAL
ncbi:MAG: cadmium-translocating P-type ATPase [Burkholderiales bacterium]|nr:cadmium-translocating P-type ATPase [Burkholderiales bacterium]